MGLPSPTGQSISLSDLNVFLGNLSAGISVGRASSLGIRTVVDVELQKCIDVHDKEFNSICITPQIGFNHICGMTVYPN